MKSELHLAPGSENPQNVKGLINNNDIWAHCSSSDNVWMEQWCCCKTYFSTKPLKRKWFFLLSCMNKMSWGCHYTQSNKGICANVLLSMRCILLLPPLGPYSDPSVRLVISFSRPNCLLFVCFLSEAYSLCCLSEFSASGVRSITCWSWHFNASFVGVTHRIMRSNEVISLRLPLKGNFRCPLDSREMFWGNYQHKD